MSEDRVALEVVVIKGKVRCVYLDNERIAGAKPYADEPQKLTSFNVDVAVLQEILRRVSGQNSEEMSNSD